MLGTSVQKLKDYFTDLIASYTFVIEDFERILTLRSYGDNGVY